MRAFQRLHNVHSAYKVWCALWPDIKTHLTAGQVLEVEIRPERRNTEQNSLMWATLSEIARQVDWHGQHLSKEEWKDVLSASLKRQKVVPGVDGGFVVLGSSTSKMTKGEMSELIELAYAFGATHGVEFAEVTSAV
jgi:hypothetical protein